MTTTAPLTVPRSEPLQNVPDGVSGRDECNIVTINESVQDTKYPHDYAGTSVE
jgi:hypothetical protein